MATPELEAIEVDLLLEGLQRHFGLDLRGLVRPTLLRRLRRLMADEGVASISALQALVLHDEAAVERLQRALLGHRAPLFDDPDFWLAFRRKVVPDLRTHPTVRAWVASCGSGEAAWSLAMLLDEEGLLGRARIYATEAVGSILQSARSGALGTLSDVDEARWRRAGGEGSLERHVTSASGAAEVKPHLKAAVFFAEHNLATDGPFNEFNVVLCRNVLLSFNRSLHNRVHGRLHESLGRFGVLGLGRKESLQRTPHAGEYEEIEGGGRLFRRVA